MLSAHNMKGRKTEKRNKCGDCHLCCEYFMITLNDIPADALSFFKTWGIEVDHNCDSSLLKIYSPCQHLTVDGCDTYDSRPQYCREYKCDRTGKI
jgi:Fe-S-cluster containining protein